MTITPESAIIAASILILAFTLHRIAKGYRPMFKSILEQLEVITPIVVALFGSVVAERDALKIERDALAAENEALRAQIAEQPELETRLAAVRDMLAPLAPAPVVIDEQIAA